MEFLPDDPLSRESYRIYSHNDRALLKIIPAAVDTGAGGTYRRRKVSFEI